jgi:hypothetical protein
MDEILAIFLSFASLSQPIVNKPTPMLYPTGSVTITGLSPAEVEVINDPNFRPFLIALAEIQNNYRKAGTIDTKRLMTGALKGALRYGVDDKYSMFVPSVEVPKYLSSMDGMRKVKSGKIVEEVFVTWKMIRHKVAYVKISEFATVSIGQFNKAATEMVKNKPTGLIIDLRDNPGGHTNVLFDILDYLLLENNLVAIFQEYGSQEYWIFPAQDHAYRSKKQIVVQEDVELLKTIPIVVLMNAKSASASEIMISALRDSSRAKSVGEKSFGKGIFQSHAISPLGWSKMTTGKWFTPEGVWIHGKGIEPDFKVKDTRIKKIKNSYDAQLQKAISVIRSEIKRATSQLK